MWKDGFGILHQKDWMVYWRLISTISKFIKHYLTNPRLAISCNDLLTIKFHQSIALPKGWVWMCWKFQGCRCHILYGSPAPVTLEVHIFVGGGSCLWDWNLLNLLCYFASNFTNALFFEMYKTNLEGSRWNQRITLWTETFLKEPNIEMIWDPLKSWMATVLYLDPARGVK